MGKKLNKETNDALKVAIKNLLEKEEKEGTGRHISLEQLLDGSWKKEEEA